MTEQVGGNEVGLRGLFEGFEGHRTVSPDDIADALSHGLVTVDTNVLLNLYRYDDAARDDLFKVLQAFGDRLFVPHQVVVEFWRNRSGVLTARSQAAQETLERLEQIGADADTAVRTWANRLAIADDQRAALLSRLSDAFADVGVKIEESAGGDQGDARDTSKDAVLLRLEPLLAGKVGPPLSDEDHASAVLEGLRRVEVGIPPGFKDKDKPGNEPAGDYLVWVQSLREARRRASRSLVFVTGDRSGDDWWRRESGQIRGPRLELFEEARREAGANLLMFRPQTLVLHAQAVLGIEINEATVSSLERTDEASDNHDHIGWTLNTVDAFMERLFDEGFVQHRAILAAVDNDGFVSREQVYQLGGYDATRTLRGFTRPTKRITQDLQDDGLLAPAAVEPLQTVYDPDFSYVTAAGFRVPHEFAALVAELLRHDQPDTTAKPLSTDDVTDG